jgi:hypothetical protein
MTRAQNPNPAPPVIDSPDRDDGSEPSPRLGLSLAQVAGGALASVTAALAASQLGVGGTISGAAFGSVVSTVAATLYAHSLKTAAQRLRNTRTVLVLPARGGPSQSDPAAVPPTLDGSDVREAEVDDGALERSGPPGRPAGGDPADARPGHVLTRLWKPVLGLAALVFVLAMATIAATELLIGHPVSAGTGNGGGTTIGRVFRDERADEVPATAPTPSPTDTSVAPEDSATPEPSTVERSSEPEATDPGTSESDDPATSPSGDAEEPASGDAPSEPTQAPSGASDAGGEPPAGE